MIDPEELKAQNRRRYIFMGAVFVVLHVALILGPLGFSALLDKVKPPKQNIYRVKIGGRELSTAPEVGAPERTRPQPVEPTPSVPPPPAEPTPPAPPAPKKTIPTPKPKPKPKPKKKTPPKPKKKPKPKRDLAKERRAKQKKLREEKRKKELARQKWLEKVARRKKLAEERRRKALEEQVYKPPAGNNFNPNVPLGSRNRGQQRGKQDNRTPGGGATVAMEKFQKRLIFILKDRWRPPIVKQVNGRTLSAVIELTVSGNGQVLAKKITKSSGSAKFDQTVEALLYKLDRVNAPPDGAITFEVELRPEL